MVNIISRRLIGLSKVGGEDLTEFGPGGEKADRTGGMGRCSYRAIGESGSKYGKSRGGIPPAPFNPAAQST
jgi:hypothetical protein